MTGETHMRQLFSLDLGKFNLAGGLGYALSLLLAWALLRPFDLAAYVAGVAALLVWLSDVPGPLRHRLAGMGAFAGASILFSLVTHLLGDTLWPHIVAVLLAGFAGTIVMVFGQRAQLVGWVFIIWAIIAPVFEVSTNLAGIVVGLAVGSAVVVAVVLMTELVRGRQKADGGPDLAKVVDLRTPHRSIRYLFTFKALGYAMVVGLVMAITSLIGWRSVSTDPSWVANAALMVIGPDSRKLGYMGVQRALGTILGVLLGFWLIQALAGSVPAVIAATFIVSFLIVATMNVNYICLTFFWTIFMSLGWGLQGREYLRHASIERIGAELLGVAIAVAAVFALEWITRDRPVNLQEKQHDQEPA